MQSIVSRDRELAALDTWLDQTVAGRGVTALVSGEPGIGKSRYLETATERAQDRGFAVAWGHAWEVSSAPLHWPWIEVLRSLLARPGGRDGAEPLLQLLPELGHGPAAPLADPFPLYDAVIGYLAAASAREPILIVLDDLHAADPSSLRLADLVAAQLRRMRVALLGSYRDVEARLSPATEAALVRLGATARTAYRDRIVELQRDLEQAEAWNDAGRRERIEAELDTLSQLSNAFGLGGRQRRSGVSSERARQNVRRRISDAMQRIAQACPEIGRHLAHTIRTGATCSYDPSR